MLVISSGARPVLPMGVAPEAIVEFLFEYRLKVSLSASRIFVLQKLLCYSYDFFIGCVTSAPNGSSSRGYNGELSADYRLKASLTSIS
jgi:hypothetical protein